jgi:chromosome segregation ATPase
MVTPEENLSLMENKHRKLKEENKVFLNGLKDQNAKYRQFSKDLENLDVDTDYDSLLKLEKKITIVNEALEKLVEKQKKKYTKVKTETFVNKNLKNRTNIKKFKLRNNQAVLDGEKLLKSKNVELAETIKRIKDYEEIISNNNYRINLGVKKYDAEDIYDFEDQISKYQERISRLNSRISNLEYKRSSIENNSNSRRNTEYSEELNEELDDIHNKIGETNQELINHLDDLIQDCRDTISDYEDAKRKVQDIIDEDEQKLTIKEMHKAKKELPQWYHYLDLERDKKLNLEKEIKPLKEIIDADKNKKINIISLQIAVEGNLLEILNHYTEVRSNHIRASKDNLINKYKNKKNKSIKDHITILFKKVTL